MKDPTVNLWRAIDHFLGVVDGDFSQSEFENAVAGLAAARAGDEVEIVDDAHTGPARIRVVGEGAAA